MLDDGEAEPGSADLAAAPGVDAVETLGQTRNMVGGNAVAMVDHAEADQVRPRIGEPHPDLRPRFAIFERVDDQIVEHLGELAAVSGDQGVAGAALDPDRA